jgi:hypothetical protein
MVARLQPAAAWIADQDMPERSMPAMPAFPLSNKKGGSEAATLPSP